MLLIAGALTVLVLACSSTPGPELLAAGNDDQSLAGAQSDTDVLVITPTVPTVPVEVEEPEPEPEPEDLPPESTVPLVIFDTDMGPDIDDVLALGMLHSYQKQGVIEIAAVTVSRKSEAGSKYSDVVNTFYGRPDIPIGMYYGDMSYSYDDRLSYVSTADSWPNDVANSPIEPGYIIQRRVLADAAAAGRSVIIIQTGFSGNLSDLVESSGDDISPKSGRELIDESVTLLSIMAGSFDLRIVEFNVEKDIESARKVFDQWPGPMAVSPFELGNAIHYPYSSITSDYGWVDRHPVRTAYEFEDLGWHQDSPPFYNMKSWDLTSVIEAIEPGADFFKTTATGTVTVDGSGQTYFSEGSGQHYLLDRAKQYSQQERQRVINRMIELSSDQP